MTQFNSTTAKFLTLFTIPVLFQCSDDTPNCYQDISFINGIQDADLSIRKQFYLNDAIQTTENDSLGVLDEGVIRLPLEADCTYDRVDITVVTSEESVSNLFTDADQQGTGAVDWVSGSGGFAEVTLLNGQQSEQIGFNFEFIGGVTYDITQLISVAGGGTGQQNVVIRLYDDFSGSFTNQRASTSYLFATSNTVTITPDGDGSYLVIQIVRTGGAGSLVYTLGGTTIEEAELTETKQFRLDCGCSEQDLTLTWLNNLGGFDYWKFTAQKDHIIEIQQALTTKKNIFPQWPKSYGANADTIRKQTSRISNKAFTIRSQHLSEAESDAIAYLKSSVLVQIINSRTDRRTVLVDTESFIKYKDQDDLYSITFNISFTDDLPAQTV